MKNLLKTNNIAHRIIEGQAYIINSKTSTLHELDETGTFIWKLLEKGKAPREIAESLAANYDVSTEQAFKDTKEFLCELETKGILEPAS
jgi:Coenzyme PQQ synthesis protein D (PqqD)